MKSLNESLNLKDKQMNDPKYILKKLKEIMDQEPHLLDSLKKTLNLSTLVENNEQDNHPLKKITSTRKLKFQEDSKNK